jgi:hypothetical protein
MGMFWNCYKSGIFSHFYSGAFPHVFFTLYSL